MLQLGCEVVSSSLYFWRVLLLDTLDDVGKTIVTIKKEKLFTESNIALGNPFLHPTHSQYEQHANNRSINPWLTVVFFSEPKEV